MPDRSMPPVWLIMLLGAIAAAAIVVPFVRWLKRRDRVLNSPYYSMLSGAGGLMPHQIGQVRRSRRYADEGLPKNKDAPRQEDYDSIAGDLTWAELQASCGSYSFLIFRGPKRSGKTVLAHHVATLRARRGDRVIVFDPDARPGMWPGCEVHGAGDDWTEMIEAMTNVLGEITGRRKSRTGGRRVFDKITVVFSEAADIMRWAKPTARLLFESLARRGEKIGCDFILDVHDTQAGTLDLEGATHLLHNADMVISVRKSASERWASVDGRTCPIPQLTDPEALADRLAESILVPAEGDAPPPRTAQDTSITADTSTNAAEALSGPQDAPEPTTKAAERQALAIARWVAGKSLSGNDIAALLGGNRNDQLARLKAAQGASKPTE